MRQYELPIRSIVNGLRRESDALRGPIALIECMNAKPRVIDRPSGTRKLVPHDAITNPLITQEINWPFPQLFRGSRVTLLAAEDVIYTVDESDWSIIEIVTYDYNDIESLKSPISGGPWHFMDFGDAWILTNESCSVFKSGVDKVGGTSKVLVQSDVVVTTGCVSRGRSILAGFSPVYTEDLLLFTEVDPNSHITLTTSRCTFAVLDKVEAAYAYQDKGEDYFSGDFSHDIKINMSGFTDAGLGAVWMLSDMVGAMNDIKVAGEYYIALWYSFAGLMLVEQSVDAYGSMFGSGAFVIDVDTTYYLTIKRREGEGSYGRLYCYIYSDSSRSILLHTLSVYLHSKENLRYIYTTASSNSGAAGTISGYVEAPDMGQAGGYWSEGWINNWRSMLTKIPDGFTPDFIVDESYVMYSSIGGGGGDLYWLLYPEVARTGFEGSGTATRPRWIEELKRNEMGFMPMPFQGAVLAVKPLGRNIIVYCENGVAALTLQSEMPGYGLEVLSDTGIPSRSAVAGDESQHAYVDTYGELHHISVDLKDTRLGYREFISPMLGNTILGSYDDMLKEFYFCDGTIGFVLTEGGLGQMVELPTTLFRDDEGVLTGIFSLKGDSYQRIRTDILDWGVRANKTLDSVEVVCSSDVPVEVSIDYRYAKNEPFRSTEWVTTNKQGIAMFPIMGLEFRVAVRGHTYSEVSMDYIILRLKNVDKRFRRGTYVSPASA